MVWNKRVGDYRRWALVGMALVAVSSMAVRGLAQDGFRAATREDRVRDGHYHPHGTSPSLSEATALLEAAVRTMYKNIEPGTDDASPNELLAYADLRALRLYTGALEVAGWSLEHAAADYQRFQTSGAYRGGYRSVTDQQAVAAWEKYRSYRETARTLLYRVRETAVSVEHQVSFCDPSVSREWRQVVLPVLRDTIAATEPMFEEQFAYQSYGIPGQTVSRIVQGPGNGIPAGAVEVNKTPTYQPYNGQGRGQGRYFEVRAFGGPIRVVAIRFRSQENAFGLLGTSGVREVRVDQVVEPGRPLFVPGNRRRWVDVSDLEVDWESADRGRRVYGTIDLVESSPEDQNN